MTSYSGTDGTLATNTVITNSFLEIGCGKVLGSKRGFINFTRDLLTEDRAFLLPRERVVIEILENITLDAPVIQACRRLKEAGYAVALDDVVDSRAVGPLIRLADYAKIEFPALNTTQRHEICRYFHEQGLQIVAEKIETDADFKTALSDGCELFQGYFFARPEIVSGRQIPSSKMACLRLISEAQRRDLDFDRLESIVRLDIALARKLLCFVNSAAFSFRHEVHTIAQAFVCLGENRIRKWVSMAALPALATDRPAELVTASLVRARFCERASEGMAYSHRAASCFLVGLLSLLDTMVGRPLDEVLGEMALDEQITSVLLNKNDADQQMRSIFEMALAFERSDFDEVARLAAARTIPAGTASEWHVEAMTWADTLPR